MKKRLFFCLLIICSLTYAYSQESNSLNQSENEILDLNDAIYRKASKRLKLEKSRIRFFHIFRVEFPAFSDSVITEVDNFFLNYQLRQNCVRRFFLSPKCKLSVESFIFSDEGVLLYYWNRIGKSSGDGKNYFGIGYYYAESLFNNIVKDFDYAFIPIMNNIIPIGSLFVLAENNELVFYKLDGKLWLAQDKDYFLNYFP